ncbi:flavodoxin [Aerococcus sp. 1KP-2016]|uniref:flavodoxin n=1 Tax=Aerococcus sp. 1KP-2016 TaxID=1981982 RepID=UPI000B99307E|nr:flavodoxin [Aerococcus sp. 1KP-2016]OYQ65846.1 flavodoxin [Aerococcus sp. 1KP-2016]
MPTALVTFASLTGNDEEIANIMTKSLLDLGVEAKMIECQSVYASDFLNEDICIVVTYTYGAAADLPDEIVDLYEELPEVNLEGKIFAALGSGEYDYEEFCKSVDDFTAQFKQSGAIMAGESVKIELYPEDDDIPAIQKLAQECVTTFQAHQAS